MSNCHTIGGLVGLQSGGFIQNCSCQGNIYIGDTGMCIGGLVGKITSGSIECSFGKCYITAGMYGNNIGGLVGLAGDDTVSATTISDCYSAEALWGGLSNAGFAGLIGNVGSNCTVSRCYSRGYVYAYESYDGIGGLIGYNFGTVTDSYWDIWSSGQNGSADGMGMATWQMWYSWYYSYWDFAPVEDDGTPAIWVMHEGDDYPRLVWQPLIPGDIDGTFDAVNLSDLQLFAAYWMNPCNGDCQMADIDNSHYVDFADFVIIARHWTEY